MLWVGGGFKGCGWVGCVVEGRGVLWGGVWVRGSGWGGGCGYKGV